MDFDDLLAGQLQGCCEPPSAQYTVFFRRVMFLALCLRCIDKYLQYIHVHVSPLGHPSRFVARLFILKDLLLVWFLFFLRSPRLTLPPPPRRICVFLRVHRPSFLKRQPVAALAVVTPAQQPQLRPQAEEVA